MRAMPGPSSPADRRPAGLCAGPGHVVLYGNPAFIARFGARCIGMPAREVMGDLPDAAFQTLDAVLREGRPLARWVRVANEEWRMTVTPRRDPEDDSIYGVAFHLRARSDVPVLPRGDPGR